MRIRVVYWLNFVCPFVEFLSLLPSELFGPARPSVEEVTPYLPPCMR